MTPLERKAALVVAARATDATDGRNLLEALGLVPPAPKRRGRKPRESAHGSARRYELGCHCDVCRTAATTRAREWRARVRSDPTAADRAGHGKAGTYKNYACRCDPCRAAHRESLVAAKERRDARTAAAG